MKVWGTDLDGCIALIEPELERRICEEFNIDPASANRVEFYMHDRYDVPEDVMNDFLGSDKCFADPQFWLKAEPHIENIAEMNKWVLMGSVPSIITGRWPHTRLATEVWCTRFNVPYSNALFGTKNRKHKAVIWTDCSFFIEDRFEEAVTIARKTDAMSYMFRTPYNDKHYEESKLLDLPNLIWVDSYQEITEREFKSD